ncbi:hypothetical protein PC113_g15769 [Phytophthora cactorum]|uniref:Uncharacterized protein n=1 Tax=Phytophthora cactorum TaxID=29920 RepID=A0A8T0YTS9_9STRA|nr:hypothetical protein PC113_g15769 [Phytophthora cactorum]
MKVVVAGIEYVFETGSEPSTAVVVNMNTTMAVSMGVGLVSDYDMERVVEIVAIVERASENLLSAEACLCIDFAKINCDDPERVRVLRATNRGSWIVPLVSRKVNETPRGADFSEKTVLEGQVQPVTQNQPPSLGWRGLWRRKCDGVAPEEFALDTQSEDVEIVQAERMASVGLGASLPDTELKVSVEATEASTGTVLASLKGVRFENDGEKKTLPYVRLFTPEEIDLMMQGSSIGADQEDEGYDMEFEERRHLLDEVELKRTMKKNAEELKNLTLKEMSTLLGIPKDKKNCVVATIVHQRVLKSINRARESLRQYEGNLKKLTEHTIGIKGTTDLPLKLGSLEKMVTFIVVSRFHVDAILDTDTLKAFRAVINLGSNTMTLKDTGEAFPLGALGVEESHLTKVSSTIRLPPGGQAIGVTDVEGNATEATTVLVEGLSGLDDGVKIARTPCTVQSGKRLVETCNASRDDVVIRRVARLAVATVVPESAFEAGCDRTEAGASGTAAADMDW